VARKKSIELGVLNVTAHPHPPGVYLKLFQAVAGKKIDANFRADQFARLSTLHPLEPGNDLSEGFWGFVYRYIKLDSSDPWFDLEHNAATDAFHIPNNVAPGLVIALFEFRPKIHRLVVQTKTANGKRLGINSYKLFFERLLNHPKLQLHFPKIEVQTEPRTEAVEQILNMPVLRRVEIHVRRPNPDDPGEKDVLKRLDEMNAEQQTEIIVAQPKKGLKLDRSTRALARIAASNGHVFGAGTSADGKKQELNTLAHPFVDQEKFDPKLTTEHQTFFVKARSMLERIKSRL